MPPLTTGFFLGRKITLPSVHLPTTLNRRQETGHRTQDTAKGELRKQSILLANL